MRCPPPGATESEDILALIFNVTAATAGQGVQTDEHLHNKESFAAFMASCREGAPTAVPGTTSALRHTAQNREPASPTRDNASASYNAHLCCNYAALRPVAAVHATTAGDRHAGGQPVEVVSQHPHAQDTPTHQVRTPEAAGTVDGQRGEMLPRVAQPLGRERLGYAQSKGDAQRPSAEVERAGALNLDLWRPQTSNMEHLILQVRTRWVLLDIHHIMNGTGTMADVLFHHHEGRHSPPPTVQHPSQWWYVATALWHTWGPIPQTT